MATSKKAPDEATVSTPDTDTSMSPAQLAARRFTLERPDVDPRERAWSQATGVTTRQGVVNAEDGFDYRYLVTSQYPADGRELHAERQKLVSRGFEPITGPLAADPEAAREYVLDEPSAEVWRRVQDIADDEWRAELARRCLDKAFAEHYRRRCVMPGAPEDKWLPSPLADAMLVHHGLEDRANLRGQAGKLADRIKAMCRKFRVHPGAPVYE